ncbi:adenosylcobinamide-phosphate synthase CbiB [Lichenifustis flavocetrariae]|uniref:Cobalamin biosynthesis protein CobD n=1 Tax=Lichenifustis flavocetrariae TaxID=2949735 RepID=A0AA41Z2R2_9HYPH|nr:adenosylcobinamide-phosphate synthase CbiB [Lichenifustis flavocetrariae]MCW6508217.1 adenosylcobinamide-phosphate synthase CbiB [Lichenifustis flavocetrariae]
MPANTFALTAAALMIEAVVGYPAPLFSRIRHPVVWMGALLSGLDRRLNNPAWSFAGRRVSGVVALGLLLVGTAAVTSPFVVLVGNPAGWLLTAMLAASLPAQRSLDAHVAAVADALDAGGLVAGRQAVSMIVGRNPMHLDEAGVARAAIESLAENFSDGIVAPAFWLAVGGLPGGALYKAINTADSMIGHRSERYAAFGWASARLDDLVNLPASRLSVLWLVTAAALVRRDGMAALRAALRDARHHRSPNAGWPEAAMAGGLGIALAGPRVYGDARVDDRFIGGDRLVATSLDIRHALTLYRVACALQCGSLALLAIVMRFI